MKFHKAIKFNEAPRGEHEDLSISNNVHNKVEISKSSPARVLEANGASTLLGLSGIFIRIHDDDTSTNRSDEEGDDDSIKARSRKHYQDEPHWPNEKRESVKKVRYVICTLALLGMALGLMSRLILNVSIVEMVRQTTHVVPAEDLNSTKKFEITTLTPSVDLIIDGEETFTTTMAPTTTTIEPPETINGTTIMRSQAQIKTGELDEIDLGDGHDDQLHFNWTKQQQNMILGAFYIGYAPGIFFAGGIAELYGSKWPLFICIFGSSIINALTPIIARYNLHLLMISRILMGAIQGSLFPSLYELFNRWLTPTESSIFAPMIKVSMPMGSLIGTLMPGVLASFGLEWPLLFYIGGGLCLLWSMIWLYVATSTPQTNRFVEENELRRIMRKKRISISSRKLSSVETRSRKDVHINDKSSEGIDQTMVIKPQQIVAKTNSVTRPPTPKKRSTPWLLIVTNPSVLALTLVKFTYNMGMDFIYLEVALYLREAHHASIETISAIASGGYCMQMVLITFVGWLAKNLVAKRVLGFSVTKWRKTFQGGSNLFMALAYLILAVSDPCLEYSACLLLAVCFAWMFGAGGESMVPYDLSSKYPASIVGFAHSVSILSGIAVPAICSIILGEETEDHNRWSLLYYLMAGALAFGGFVFCLVLKAKPFLPEEKNRTTANNRQQQICSVDMTR